MLLHDKNTCTSIKTLWMITILIGLNDALTAVYQFNICVLICFYLLVLLQDCHHLDVTGRDILLPANL